MTESPHAQRVWQYLEGLGCEQIHSTFTLPNGQLGHRVVIWQRGQVVATGEHALATLARSAALLEAMRALSPPPRR